MIAKKHLDFGFNELKKIYHVSDVHIRNFKRHEEYRRVFDRLVDYVKIDGEKQSVIIVTGDIVHSKTDVTPELIKEVQYFLKTLSAVRHVIVTAGNHDANLNNPNRLDTLSPIVEAINSDRIHYLKDGGVYRFCDIDFCVWSVFDQPHDYVRANQLTGSFKIATYHGPVTNAVTEIGFKLTRERVSVSDFEGYDLVLLGDIHKFQYLNEVKTVAYPGSIIQQSHGEGLEHGIITWDLEKRSSEFVRIHNDTAFFTVHVNSGDYDSTNLPKNVSKLYLRVRHKNTSQSQVKKIVAKIKQKYEVIEVSNQKERDHAKDSVEYAQNEHVTDTRDVEYQNSVITEYLKHKYKLSENDIIPVLEINRAVNRAINHTDSTRNTMWTIKKFEFDNMFSYGKGNYVDFSKMEGTYGLFAANASGKSTMLDALAFCLFDKCSKTFKGSHVINNQSDSFSCKVIFEMNGREYIISRSSIRQKNGNVRVEVDFSFIDERGIVYSLNGKERSDTNANIRKVIGSYEDFVLTALSPQNGGVNFVDMNQKDRKEVLSQFLDINVFEELYAVANATQREYLALLKNYNKKNYQEELINYEKSLLDCERNLTDLLDLKSEIDNEITKKTDELVSLGTLVTNSEEMDVDIDDISQKIVIIEKNVHDLEDKLKTHKDQKFLYSKEYEKLQDSLSSTLSDEDIKMGLIKYEEDAKNKEIALKEVTKYESIFSSIKDKVAKLDHLKYDPNCKYCIENIFVKDALAASSSFKESENELKTKIATYERAIYEFSGSMIYKKAHEEKSKLTTLSAEAYKKVSESSIQITKIESKIKENKAYLSGLENQVLSYEKNKESIAKDKEVRSSMNEIKKQIDLTKQKQNAVSQKITEKLSEKKVILAKKSECENKIREINELEKNSKNYDYYLSAVHRDGVPHSIIKNTLPKIENEVNEILCQLVDFRILLDTDDKNVNGYIVYDDNRCWPIELSSGMEKFVSSIAIRNALMSISTLPRPNFMAIDEGFGVLSSENLSSMPVLFDYLKNQFKFVLTVSHIDAMRDYVDSHIEIHKVNGRSSVRF